MDLIKADESAFRIAHISDTHVSPEYHRRNIVKLRDLLEHVVEDGFDHVVITGDITANGEVRGYRSARRLLKQFGLMDYNKLTVTVGNHDIFGGVHRAEDLLTFGKQCRSTSYDSQLRLFERMFRETLPGRVYREENIFPFVKIVGPAAFIGVNSIGRFHPLLNCVGSNGFVSDAQLYDLEKLLKHPSVSSLKKIVLIHHHFNRYTPYSDSLGESLYHRFESATLKLHRRRRVEDVLRECGVDVVLHGHTHIEAIYNRGGLLFSSTALNPIRSKSETKENRGPEELMFNEITISGSGEVVVTKRRIAARQKGSSSRAVDRRLKVE